MANYHQVTMDEYLKDLKAKNKGYTCGYKHCLHSGEKVPSDDSVIIGNRHYHKDCADIKRKITDCAKLYMEYIDDKTKYPIVLRIINTLVFKNRVPVDYILKQLPKSMNYFKDKPVHVLYGIKTAYWTKDFAE